MKDRGIYKCIAPYARVFKTEAVTYIEFEKGNSFLYCYFISNPLLYVYNALLLSLTALLGQRNRTVHVLSQL